VHQKKEHVFMFSELSGGRRICRLELLEFPVKILITVFVQKLDGNCIIC